MVYVNGGLAGLNRRCWWVDGVLEDSISNTKPRSSAKIKGQFDEPLRNPSKNSAQICANSKTLAEAKRAHAQITKFARQQSIFAWNTLMNAYLKCSSLFEAFFLFQTMPERNIFTWTIIMDGYANCGCVKGPLDLFWLMQLEGIRPDKVTLICILNASTDLGILAQGKQIHACIVKTQYSSDVFIASKLIDLYIKCGSLEDGCKVFNIMPVVNEVSWTTMIAGYAQLGDGKKAFQIFMHMQQEHITPDVVTFFSILAASTKMTSLDYGKWVHGCVILSKCSNNPLECTLIDMYAKCGNLEAASQIFKRSPGRNVATWNAFISGHVLHGDDEGALRLFKKFQEEHMKPDKVTFISCLTACARTTSLEKGKYFHSLAAEFGVDKDIFVGSALVDMYVKCDKITVASYVFDRMRMLDVVPWSAMIAGYADDGNGKEAVKLFWTMCGEGKLPNEVTLLAALGACTKVAALEDGKRIHSYILNSNYRNDISVGSAIVDMYAKCGNMKAARQVFEVFTRKNDIMWNILIAGYAQHGDSMEVFGILPIMHQSGFNLDSVTFVSILSVCSHVGLITEGCHYFNMLSHDSGTAIAPQHHYVCIVDVLGNAGWLDVAEDFIMSMPFQPGIMVWLALLGACKLHVNVNKAEHAAEQALKLDPYNDAAIIMLSSIYAIIGRWQDKLDLRKLMILWK